MLKGKDNNKEALRVSLLLSSILKQVMCMGDKNYEVVISRDGKNVLHITEKDRSVYLGSKYNAGRDIQFFMDTMGDIGSEDVIIIFGLACGEHLYELLKKLGEKNKVIVFEPDDTIINLFQNLEIADSIISDGRFRIYHFNQEQGIETTLGRNISDYQLSGIIFNYYPNYDQVYSDQFMEFISQFKDFLRKLQISKNTNMVFSKIWFDSFLKNVRIMSTGIPVDELKDRYLNKPAIIVSAGPSLKKNINLLKKAQDKFIIIAGGRTLKALIDIGVTPHFLCIVDPGEINLRFVEENLDCTTPLVFYEGTNPDVAEKYKGPKIYFTANHFIHNFIQPTNVRLNLGGSVAHTCFGLAMHLGCDKVIFIGQDFAFPGDKMHAENALTKSENNKIGDSERYFYVDDIYGNKVKTNIVFDMFRKTMENLIKMFPGRLYINSTEGGANIRGTTVMPLEDAINKYSGSDIEYFNYHSPKKIDSNNVIEKTKDILEELINIKSDCREGVKLADRLAKAFHHGLDKKIKRINEKLNKIDNKIKKVFAKAAFVNFILYPVTQMVLGNKEFIINQNDTEAIKGRKVISRTKKLYEEMSQKLDEAIIIIKNLSNSEENYVS